MIYEEDINFEYGEFCKQSSRSDTSRSASKGTPNTYHGSINESIFEVRVTSQQLLLEE